MTGLQDRFLIYVRRGGSRGLWFLAPSLLGVVYLVLAPTADVLRRSFATALSGQWVGLDNYRKVFPYITAHQNSQSRTLPHIIHIGSQPGVQKALPGKDQPPHQHYRGRRDGHGQQIQWLAGLKAIPAEQTEAARVDGAGRIRCFFQITLPNLKGSAYTITVLSLLNAFKSFREAYLVSGAYPQQDIYLLQHLFQNWYTKLDMDKLAAGAVLMALALGALSMLLQRLWNTAEEL